MFGCDCLRDLSFLYFFSFQLSTSYLNFKQSIDTWLDGGMMFKRGKCVLAPEVRQAIYDTWIDHSVASTDNRNNCASVQISKKEYIQRYNRIENKTVQLEESKNKHGQVNISANCMIVIETVRSIHKSLWDKGFNVCLGSVLNLKPFFITYTSEKEMSLCLNTKFVFDALMSKAKKDGNESFTSITSFLMDSCSCPKGENGYHKWLCSIKKCKDCKDIKPAPLKCSSSK